LTPGVYAMITDGFAGRDLGRAMGTLTGTAAVGLSVGPLLGGLLVDVAGWRWIFFINLPVAVFTAVAVLRAVPAGRRGIGPRIDLAGLVLLALGLTALSLGLLQGGPDGWTAPLTLGLLAIGVAGLVAFWFVESRVPDPLVDPAVLRQPQMAAANAVGFCMQFVSTGVTVLVAIWLQEGLRASALLAGVALLPMTLPITVASLLAGRLVQRFGARRLVIVGAVTVAVGTAAIGLGALSGSYPPVVPGLILFGCGFAVVLTSLTTALMAGAGELDRGMVSGIYNTARNVGASVGVGVTNSLLLGLAVTRGLDEAFAVTMFVTAAVAAVGGGAALALARPSSASAADQLARGHDQIPRHI
jgi:MFS family permease